MKDIIDVVDEIWNHPERLAEREKLLAEMEARGEVERIDDILLLIAREQGNTQGQTQL